MPNFTEVFQTVGIELPERIGLPQFYVTIWLVLLVAVVFWFLFAARFRFVRQVFVRNQTETGPSGVKAFGGWVKGFSFAACAVLFSVIWLFGWCCTTTIESHEVGVSETKIYGPGAYPLNDEAIVVVPRFGEVVLQTELPTNGSEDMERLKLTVQYRMEDPELTLLQRQLLGSTKNFESWLQFRLGKFVDDPREHSTELDAELKTLGAELADAGIAVKIRSELRTVIRSELVVD